MNTKNQIKTKAIIVGTIFFHLSFFINRGMTATPMTISQESAILGKAGCQSCVDGHYYGCGGVADGDCGNAKSILGLCQGNGSCSGNVAPAYIDAKCKSDPGGYANCQSTIYHIDEQLNDCVKICLPAMNGQCICQYIQGGSSATAFVGENRCADQ